MIFNPSLTIPQGYPITRPETNPPFYDMNSLIPDFNNRINQLSFKHRNQESDLEQQKKI